jgi:hypothetical protein
MKKAGLPVMKQYHLEGLNMGAIGIRDLLRQGLLEYVDCNEENNTLIAVSRKRPQKRHRRRAGESSECDIRAWRSIL